MLDDGLVSSRLLQSQGSGSSNSHHFVSPTDSGGPMLMFARRRFSVVVARHGEMKQTLENCTALCATSGGREGAATTLTRTTDDRVKNEVTCDTAMNDSCENISQPSRSRAARLTDVDVLVETVTVHFVAETQIAKAITKSSHNCQKVEGPNEIRWVLQHFSDQKKRLVSKCPFGSSSQIWQLPAWVPSVNVASSVESALATEEETVPCVICLARPVSHTFARTRWTSISFSPCSSLRLSRPLVLRERTAPGLVAILWRSGWLSQKIDCPASSLSCATASPTTGFHEVVGPRISSAVQMSTSLRSALQQSLARRHWQPSLPRSCCCSSSSCAAEDRASECVRAPDGSS